MSNFTAIRIDRSLPPEERVVQAALAYIKAYSRIPTQDQIVQALSQPDGEGKSTGKATVNKYWGSFQRQLSEELSLTDWLPSEIPGFVSEHLIALVDWARKAADSELSARQIQLDDREQTLDRKAEIDEQLIKTLKEKVKELTARTRTQDKTIESLNQTVASLQRWLSENKQTLAVSREKNTHANNEIARFRRELDTLLVDFKNVEKLAKQYQNDNQQLSSQHDSLLRQHEITLLENSRLEEALVTEKNHVKALKSDLSKAHESNTTAQDLLDKYRTQAEGQHAKLELLGTLQNSVTRLGESLDKTNQRNATLEQEVLHLNTQINTLKSDRPTAHSKHKEKRSPKKNQ